MSDEDFRSVPAQLSAKLADAEARIAQLDAALAAAHGRLEWALDLLDMYDQRVVDLGDPPELVHSEVYERAKRLAREALSAPALQRAAEELRLLRELEAADEAVEEKEDYYFGACGAMG